MRRVVGDSQVFDPGSVTGSEDLGNLATAADAPLVFWFLGGADPEVAGEALRTGRIPDSLHSNHSPFYAVIQPTLTVGVDALVAAAREWLTGA